MSEQRTERDQLTARLYRAALKADDAYSLELIRVYGKKQAGTARYFPHTDEQLIAAQNVKLAADEAWLVHMRAGSRNVNTEVA